MPDIEDTSNVFLQTTSRFTIIISKFSQQIYLKRIIKWLICFSYSHGCPEFF